MPSGGPGPFRLPFGKHKGRLIEDTPGGYLFWLVSECQLRPELRLAILSELQVRLQDMGCPPSWREKELQRCVRGLKALLRRFVTASAN
jgi:uncharacterized protein (DUF3820 family)